MLPRAYGREFVNTPYELRMHENIFTHDMHFHSREIWRGKRDPQTETLWADNTLNPFILTSGDNDYGAAEQILGSEDTPVKPEYIFYDPHRILVAALSSDTVYKIRTAYGVGTVEDALSAGHFSEMMVVRGGVGLITGGDPHEMMIPRLAVGTKMWMYCWNVTNTATISLFIGFHEYEHESTF